MKRTNHTSGTRIHVRIGREGPKHDPYGYVEITVERKGHIVTGHFGLAVWVKCDGQTMTENVDAGDDVFEGLTGMTPLKAMKYNERAHPYFEDPMGPLSRYE